MEPTTIQLLGFLGGLAFGLIGIIRAVLLSYSTNHHLTSIMKEHLVLRAIIDEIHVLFNSIHSKLQQTNTELNKTNNLLSDELDTVKNQLSDLIKLNETQKS